MGHPGHRGQHPAVLLFQVVHRLADQGSILQGENHCHPAGDLLVLTDGVDTHGIGRFQLPPDDGQAALVPLQHLLQTGLGVDIPQEPPHHRAGCGPRALDGKIPIGGVGIDDAGLVVDDDDPQVQRIQRGPGVFVELHWLFLLVSPPTPGRRAR